MWVIMSLIRVQDYLFWSSTLPPGSAVNTGLNPLKVSQVSGMRMAGAVGLQGYLECVSLMTHLSQQPSTCTSWQSSSPVPPQVQSPGSISGKNCCVDTSTVVKVITHVCRLHLFSFTSSFWAAEWNHQTSEINLSHLSCKHETSPLTLHKHSTFCS